MNKIKKNFLLFTGNHNKEGIADYVEAIKQKSQNYDFDLTVSNILDFNYDGVFIIENFGDFTTFSKVNNFLNDYKGKKILICTEFINLKKNTFNSFSKKYNFKFIDFNNKYLLYTVSAFSYIFVYGLEQLIYSVASLVNAVKNLIIVRPYSFIRNIIFSVVFVNIIRLIYEAITIILRSIESMIGMLITLTNAIILTIYITYFFLVHFIITLIECLVYLINTLRFPYNMIIKVVLVIAGLTRLKKFRFVENFILKIIKFATIRKKLLIFFNAEFIVEANSARRYLINKNTVMKKITGEQRFFVNKVKRVEKIIIYRYYKSIKSLIYSLYTGNVFKSLDAKWQNSDFKEEIHMKGRYVVFKLLIDKFDFIFVSHDEIKIPFTKKDLHRLYFIPDKTINFDSKKKINLSFSGVLNTFRYEVLKNLVKHFNNNYFDN